MATLANERTALQAIVIEEIEGSEPLRAQLRGGLMAAIGAELSVESKGGKYLPIGSSRATLTTNAVDYGDSEMTISCDAAFMAPDDFQASGADLTFTPEGIGDFLSQFVNRGRLCAVQYGPVAREGVLRKVTIRPNRGYGVDPKFSGAPVSGNVFGVNMDITLRFEWAGSGIPGFSPLAVIDGNQVAGGLSAAGAGISGALADIDGLDGNFLTQLSDGVGKLQAGITKLRGTVKGIGDLARAPTKIANQAIATARSVGNLVHDVDTLVSDTTDDYKTAGAGFANLLKMKRTVGTVRQSLTDTAEAVAKIIDALESRRRKVIGVRPGQNLSDIAKRELGNADRWTEIAEANEIAGAIIPPGTFSVEIPPR